MATPSSILAWRILWTEEPGGLQLVRSRRVRQDLAVKQQQYQAHLCTWVKVPDHPTKPLVICPLPFFPACLPHSGHPSFFQVSELCSLSQGSCTSYVLCPQLRRYPLHFHQIRCQTFQAATREAECQALQWPARGLSQDEGTTGVQMRLD